MQPVSLFLGIDPEVHTRRRVDGVYPNLNMALASI